MLEPVSFDDSQKIADYLNGSQPVVVNFEATDKVVMKRMTDFISGVVYALGGSMKKLAIIFWYARLKTLILMQMIIFMTKEGDSLGKNN